MKFSVIVLLYNSNFEKIIKTLKSILDQTMEELEIIIADDGSKQCYYNEIKEFFEENNFSNYKFTPQKENVGTVKNILDGLTYSSGRYIKLIGAGDLIYDKNVLKEVYSFMEVKKAKLCFGLMKAYCRKEDGTYYEGVYRAPKDIQVYRKKTYQEKKIRRNILKYGDWISGASTFYEEKMLRKVLNEMETCVKYCEDLLTAKLVLEKEKLYLIDKFVVKYEIGSGISTSNYNESFLNRIYNDQINFYKYLLQQYDDKYLQTGVKLLYYNNRSTLLENRIKRSLIVPSRIIFSLNIQLQKYLRRHSVEDIN